MELNIQKFNSLVDQFETRVTSGGGRKKLRTWIETNLANPIHTDMSWSWKDHEWQIGIVEDTHPVIGIQKCAQSGASQLSLSIALALASVLSSANIIYTLQTTQYARKFSTTRFDPVIDSSERLQSLRDKRVDSTELKKIGTSFIHLGGAHTEASAISIPAKALLMDEISFSDARVVGAYMSRLEHLPEEEKILYQFGTPLYKGMGSTAIFESGTKNYYLCYHDKCGHWTLVDPSKDIVIPGFESKLEEITVRDLNVRSVKVSESYVKCRHCGNEISRENLADPSRRAWVPYHSDKVGDIAYPSTYQIFPTDVAGIKSIPQIIRSLSLYKTTDRFFQYGLGLPHDSSDNRILAGSVDSAFSINSVKPEEASGIYGCVIGTDTGKLSHLVIGKEVDEVFHILWVEVIKQGYEDELQKTVVDRFKRYNASMGIMDAAPDFSSVMAVQSELPYSKFYGAYFTRGGTANMLPYTIKEEEGLVAISRTRMIDHFVKEFNRGKILLPRDISEEMKDLLKKHLTSMHKVTDSLAGGNAAEGTWVAAHTETHFFMSLVYAFTAKEMTVSHFGKGFVLPSTSVSKVRVRAA